MYANPGVLVNCLVLINKSIDNISPVPGSTHVVSSTHKAVCMRVVFTYLGSCSHVEKVNISSSLDVLEVVDQEEEEETDLLVWANMLVCAISLHIFPGRETTMLTDEFSPEILEVTVIYFFYFTASSRKNEAQQSAMFHHTQLNLSSASSKIAASITSCGKLFCLSLCLGNVWILYRWSYAVCLIATEMQEMNLVTHKYS